MSRESNTQYIIGYGSLLNHDSRLRFSNLNIQPIRVRLHGWQRCWHARSYPEQQTFVGVEQAAGASLNGALIPTQTLTPELIERERDYQFIEIAPDALELQPALNGKDTTALANKTFWLCQPNAPEWPDADFPVYQSYVDTCLAGALESGNTEGAWQFIESTIGWEHNWVDDRLTPQYPRAAKLDKALIDQIDLILAQSDLLKHRK